jgi:hypothetical protein
MARELYSLYAAGVTRHGHHGGFPMAIEFQSDEERLVAEQAVLLHRAAMEAMRTAAHGHGLEVVEGTVMLRGRAFLRDLIERSLSAHPEARSVSAEAQKKGSAPERAPAEAGSPSSTTLPRP